MAGTSTLGWDAGRLHDRVLQWLRRVLLSLESQLARLA